MSPIPTNKQLYLKVKEEADSIYSKPSAYKSGWIVKTYKERGGSYHGKKGKSTLNKEIREAMKEGIK